MSSKVKKFRRGQRVPVKSVKDKKLKAKLAKVEKTIEETEILNAMNDIALPEEAGFLEAEGREKTYKYTQDEIKQNVDEQSASKIFDLDLDAFGPYSMDFTRNGRYLLLGGEKGHVALMDWSRHHLVKEFNVQDRVRDVHFLHNETMFAVAQKKYVYIYDKQGVELHALKHHLDPLALDFLSFHFLLTSIGETGMLKYQDVSTGQVVAELKTKLGRTKVMRHNPYNAVMHVGHANGVVTMWSPNMTTPLVKMMCHKGPITSLAVRKDGHQMATTGLDGQMKIWDLRNYKVLQEYFTTSPACSVDFAQKDVVAVGFNSHVQLWQSPGGSKQNAPYLTHRLPGKQVGKVRFCPYEDVLGISHSRGYSSIMVPGSGEPNFDAFEANPFQNKKQRQEAEVRGLLEKLRPEMIVLDPTEIGGVNEEKGKIVQQQEDAKRAEKMAEKKAKLDARKRMRGRSGSKKRYLRKQQGIVDEKKQKILEEREEREKKEKEEKRKKMLGDQHGAALSRFI
uniref:BING4 C-terminal domain-containing protein n=1 Tax=Palpitomonas bilix TaxID=652834 RepID=A0A7S3DE57_9EUKA